MGTLQTRLFKLERDLAQAEWFTKVGEDNLTTSIEVEPGTLAMYATHLPEAPETCYVFEVYADEEAYQTHAASPHFKAYVEMAGKVLTGRAVYPVNPELMVEKDAPLVVTDPADAAPRCCFVQILPEKLDAFREAVFANMRTSVATETGVLYLYAASFADDPLHWVFWEGYASEEAYISHTQTEHFKAYIAATVDCLSSKELIPLAADTLVSKGSLHG
ncbi:MAG: antibiotic biosynthesis monooxygenase [Atopobiaceae bacterium]|nr:antibiotic biosynthesis monooxygenase [Atopobiaceae bacterium]